MSDVKYDSYDITFQEIPDEVSLTFSLTGCIHRCKGCHSVHLRQDIGTTLDTTELGRIVDKYSKSITAVVFLGGDHAYYIHHLIDYIRSNYDSIKIGLYSGSKRVPLDLFNKLDYIKVGPYIEKLGPINSYTSNQKMYYIDKGIVSDITHKFKSKVRKK